MVFAKRNTLSGCIARSGAAAHHDARMVVCGGGPPSADLVPVVQGPRGRDRRRESVGAAGRSAPGASRRAGPGAVRRGHCLMCPVLSRVPGEQRILTVLCMVRQTARIAAVTREGWTMNHLLAASVAFHRFILNFWSHPHQCARASAAYEGRCSEHHGPLHHSLQGRAE